MRAPLIAAAVLALALPAVAGAQSPASPYVCYKARRTAGTAKFVPQPGVPIVDRFGEREGELRQPVHVCAPASIDGIGASDPSTYLVTYQQKKVTPSPTAQTRLNVRGLTVDLVKPSLAAAPAATDPAVVPPAPDPATHDVNGYQCWDAKQSKGLPPVEVDTAVTVTDAYGGPRTWVLKRLVRVCAPAQLDGTDIERGGAGLACYRARRATLNPETTLPRGLRVRDEFGTQTVDLTREDMFCLPTVIDDGTCNGDPALCARRYDQVAYATTHNAMSNADEGWLGPNQQHGITRQLEDGIRGLMLDTHYDGGVAQLCHAYCALGKETLVSGLLKIRRFLDLHPQEVVSIIFEAYVTEADTAAAFAAAGLLDYVYAKPAGEPWPPLATLIRNDTRLVVFTDERGDLPWHHYVWDHASETPYSFETPAQLSCAPNRGNTSYPLFILNHFLTQVLGSPALAEQINHDPLFIDRALACQTARNRLPNFVTVDFYDIGDVFSVTAALNGLP
jgi:hypothetical protein